MEESEGLTREKIVASSYEEQNTEARQGGKNLAMETEMNGGYGAEPARAGCTSRRREEGQE